MGFFFFSSSEDDHDLDECEPTQMVNPVCGLGVAFYYFLLIKVLAV